MPHKQPNTTCSLTHRLHFTSVDILSLPRAFFLDTSQGFDKKTATDRLEVTKNTGMVQSFTQKCSAGSFVDCTLKGFQTSFSKFTLFGARKSHEAGHKCARGIPCGNTSGYYSMEACNWQYTTWQWSSALNGEINSAECIH